MHRATDAGRRAAPGLAVPPARAAIALGANLGDAAAALDLAREALGRLPGTRVVRVSTWRRTSPVGGVPGQPDYLNGVCVAETALAPRALLLECQAIEAAAGRDRAAERARYGRYGPRPLDLDIILYGEEIVAGPDLRIPHPLFRERGFVLEPLAEIAGDWRDPETGLDVATLWSRKIAGEAICNETY